MKTMTKNKYDRIYNFSAGPAVLPEPVLEIARDELLNFKGSGMSVMEMSHRSKEFDAVIEGAEKSIREILGVPETHAVLFMQGGATHQFAMIPMNIYQKGHPVDVIHTGVWTKKAISELKILTEYNIAATTESENFSRLPLPEEIKLNPQASYVHICSNNTVTGTQYKTFPETGRVPLVADMSSDIVSRPIDVAKFGIIFAGAQKNIGPSGLALVIIDKELAERCPNTVPNFFQYRHHIQNESRFNTPPTFGIYMVGLVMDWLKQQGGLQAMAKINDAKAKIIYDAIDSSQFYTSPIKKEDRSIMNVVFRIQNGNEELEAKFVKEATSAGLSGLKGHRLVGGLRASIYNAQPIEGVEALAGFMKEFENQNG